MTADLRPITCQSFQSQDHRLAILPVREIVHIALDRNAEKLLLAHTHPSGDPKPSSSDIEVTEKLRSALQPLEITLFDHLILTADGETTSFRTLGWL